MIETHLTTPPAFCSLDAKAYGERLARIMSLMLRYEGRVENAGSGKVLRFKRGEGLKLALEWLIEAERSCCASLIFGLEEGDEECAVRVLAPELAEESDVTVRSCC